MNPDPLNFLWEFFGFAPESVTLLKQLGLMVFYILAIIIPALLATAYFTYAERKIIAAMQLRKGPNVVGPFGLLQPMADGLKLMLKEVIVPNNANKVIFLLAPGLAFALSLISWAVIPFDDGVVLADINVGILYLFAVSSLGVYKLIIAGWASNSRYAFLGGIRSSAQMVSYEVSIGFVIICVLLCVGSLNLSDIVRRQQEIGMWFILPLFPVFLVFLISALAETNRIPFDLPEAEGELVAGYFVEYSSMPFAMFFLGECLNVLLMSAVMTVLFLGGWLPPINHEALSIIPGFVWFGLKWAFMVFLFVWIRATFPRFRYDQLMRLGWKVFLPFSLVAVIATSGTLVYMGWLPK